MVTQFEAWISLPEADREVSRRTGIGCARYSAASSGVFLCRCAAPSA